MTKVLYIYKNKGNNKIYLDYYYGDYTTSLYERRVNNKIILGHFVMSKLFYLCVYDDCYFDEYVPGFNIAEAKLLYTILFKPEVMDIKLPGNQWVNF